jgi:isochorismate synthase
VTALQPAPVDASASGTPPPRDELGEECPDERLAERLARLLAPGILAAASVPVDATDPIALFAAAVEAGLEAALWLRPSEGLGLVGIGRAWAVEGDGPARFRDAEAAWRGLIRDAHLDGAEPWLLGGLGFSGRRPDAADPWGPFGPSSLVLPELGLAVRDGAAQVTAAAIGTADPRGLERQWEALVARARELTPSAAGMVARPVFATLRTESEQPSRPAWHRLVGTIAGAVGRGRLDKVVLARRVDLRSPVELDVPNALRRLAASAPESTIYAFRREGRTFLGATPERLVRVEGRSFRTAAIAGTIRRGADTAEDEALGRELLASEKDREEHAIVVAAIREGLAPTTETLVIAPQPAVMTLRHVQHLATEISGTLPEAGGLLALGARLHPTPAVGGAPREAALAMIDEHEGFDRGWYAGPVGWLGADGDGELCVALRCGIVDRTRATLFAGCGIVADSDPAREWEESRIKLRAVVAALGIPEDEA